MKASFVITLGTFKTQNLSLCPRGDIKVSDKMTIRIKEMIDWEYYVSHSQVIWFFVSHSISVHFSLLLSCRHNHLPEGSWKCWTWKLAMFSGSLWPRISSMPAPPLLSERVWCNANHRGSEECSLAGREPPATYFSLNHTSNNGRKAVVLSGVDVRALPRLCTARRSEHRCCLKRGSMTSTFGFQGTLLQKQSQTWRRRQAGVERFNRLHWDYGNITKYQNHFILTISPWNYNHKGCYLMSQRHSEWNHTFISAVHISLWYSRSSTRWQKKLIHHGFSCICQHMPLKQQRREALLSTSLSGNISNKTC